ncbi:hypothetical protein HAHI6034_05095 [Hathewaya histolytica]|uniref:Phage-like protein n=1 Tax=Hathewaya histolytica TaxID=1498 RepID=A0A4U9R7U1_HATHI|nr:hypothetical protein [Hathewaya histolytica]VTQ86858.1 phage-like protein [Hathewaya histolytica]
MNIENLKNQWLKNKNKEWKYKEICEELEEEYRCRGKSRILQLEDWKRYFYFYKPNPKGQKFIITEFYEEVKEKVDGRKTGNTGLNPNSHGNNTAEYIKNIEKLILDLLTQEGCGKVFLSKHVLLRTLKMVNENYAFCKQRIPKLSKFMSVEKATVQEWYDSTSSMLESNLETALKNLEKQSLILWSRETTVAETIAIGECEQNNKIVKIIHRDKYGEEVVDYKYVADERVLIDHREATDDEKTFILFTEREALKEMGFDNKGKLIAYGLWDEFMNKVNEIVLKELGIAFYYKSYKILFNEEHIYEIVEEIYDFELEDDNRKNQQNILNKGINNRIHNNVTKKQAKSRVEAEKMFGKIKDERLIRRASENYIQDNSKLNANLIDLKAISIREDVRRTKIQDLKIKDEEDINKLLVKI